jgi:hypothetical protein
MRSKTPKKQPHKAKELFLKYPAPTLAAVTIFSVVFSFGAAWAAVNSRVGALEEASKTLASKEELQTIREMIKALDQKIDILVNRR